MKSKNTFVASNKCWYCGTALFDYGVGQNISLTNGRINKTIIIPQCSTCKEEADDFRKYIEKVVGIGCGSSLALILGLSIVSTSVDSTPKIIKDIMEFFFQNELMAILAGIVLLFILISIFSVIIINKRKKYIREGGNIGVLKQPKDYPEIKELLEQGWRFGSALVGTKTCTSCGKSVPTTSQVGDKCPHCGAYWSREG